MIAIASETPSADGWTVTPVTVAGPLGAAPAAPLADVVSGGSGAGDASCAAVCSGLVAPGPSNASRTSRPSVF